MSANVGRNAGSADENRNARNGEHRNGRVPPRVERGRGGRRGFVAMQAPRGVPHVAFQAPNHLAAGAPVPVVFPGVPQLGVPVHAVHVGPPFHGPQANAVFPGVPQLGAPVHDVHVQPPFYGGQLHGIAPNAPMLLPHPGVVNAVVVPHPAVNVAGAVVGAQPMYQIAGLPPHVIGLPHIGANQQGIGAQPRNQGAGHPPHVVGEPHVGADQQRRAAQPRNQGAGQPPDVIGEPHIGADQQRRVAQPRNQGAGQPPHVVGEPHIGADQQRRGAQPRNQGAGQPPHVVGEPHIGADQQRRGAQPRNQRAGLPPHVVGEPHVGANQQRRGAQPRNQRAGLPPHVVGEQPHVGADQQRRSIREVISEMMEHLSEVQNHYLNLHALLMADAEPVPANAVMEPYAFQLVNNTEGLEERVVEHYRAYLSETYARFAREESVLVGFLRAVFEMHARVLFLLDVHINARNRAA